MNKVKPVIAAAVIATSLFVSCGGGDKDPVALTVNGEAVTMGEIEETAMFFRRQQMMMTPEKIFDANEADLKKGAARQLAANLLLIANVRERGWAADTARVSDMVERFIAQFPDRDTFFKQLEMMGESEESMRRGMAEEILLDSLLSSVSSGAAAVTDEEARAHYEANKDRYKTVPRVRASHIIFDLDITADSAALASTTARALGALEEAKAGADFDELIKKYSSQPEHGDMGWFKKGDLVPELEHVIFRLPKGGVSELVPSSMGIHIIKKTDEDEPRAQTFEEVSASIMKTLDFTRKGVRVNDFIDSLLLNADIKFIDKSVAFEIKPSESGAAAESKLLDIQMPVSEGEGTADGADKE